MPAFQGPEEELPWTERGSLNPSSLLRTLKVTGLRPRLGSWNFYQVRTLRSFSRKLLNKGKPILLFFWKNPPLASNFPPALWPGPYELTSPKKKASYLPNQVFFEYNPSSATSHLLNFTRTIIHTQIKVQTFFLFLRQIFALLWKTLPWHNNRLSPTSIPTSYIWRFWLQQNRFYDAIWRILTCDVGQTMTRYPRLTCCCCVCLLFKFQFFLTLPKHSTLTSDG